LAFGVTAAGNDVVAEARKKAALLSPPGAT
jgi:hypothetical protein